MDDDRRPENDIGNAIIQAINSYLRRNRNIDPRVMSVINNTLNKLRNIRPLGMGDLLGLIGDMYENRIPIPQQLLRFIGPEEMEVIEARRGNGKPRKVGRKVGGNEVLRAAIRNKLHSVEHLVQPNYLAEFTHLLNLVNNPNQNISMGLWYDANDLVNKIIRNSTRSRRRQGGNRIIGAGIFDLISPIANMFSGTSFNTPLDSIIPREISTQVASSIADEGLSGGRKMSRKNPWIAHVKSVASKKGISYTEALKIASKTYKK